MPPLNRAPTPISTTLQQEEKGQLNNITHKNIDNTNFELAESGADDTYYDASDHFLNSSANPNLATSTSDLDNSTTPLEMDSTTTVAPETCFDTLPKLEGYEDVAIRCNQKSGGGANWEWANQTQKDRCNEANALLTVKDLVECKVRNQDPNYTWLPHDIFVCGMAHSHATVIAPYRVKILADQLAQLSPNDSLSAELEDKIRVEKCAITLLEQGEQPSWFDSFLRSNLTDVNGTLPELGRDNASTASPENNWITFNVPDWIVPFASGIVVGYCGALINVISEFIAAKCVEWIMNRDATQEEEGVIVDNTKGLLH